MLEGTSGRRCTSDFDLILQLLRYLILKSYDRSPPATDDNSPRIKYILPLKSAVLNLIYSHEAERPPSWPPCPAKGSRRILPSPSIFLLSRRLGRQEPDPLA